MAKLPVKRVLLKLSGEALASLEPSFDHHAYGISQLMLEKIALEVQEVYDMGIQVCIVVGGGNIFRGAHGVAKHNLDRTTSDHMGMLATVMNGLALHNAIEAEGVPCRLMSAIPINPIAQHYVRQRAERHIDKGRVLIFVAGTGNPYFTTDTAATLRAVETKCDLLLKGTKVPGVYTKDPALHSDATHISHLTYEELTQQQYGIMDSTAIALVHEHKIPTRVFSIYAKNSFPDAVKGIGLFTTIS